MKQIIAILCTLILIIIASATAENTTFDVNDDIDEQTYYLTCDSSMMTITVSKASGKPFEPELIEGEEDIDSAYLDYPTLEITDSSINDFFETDENFNRRKDKEKQLAIELLAKDNNIDWNTIPEENRNTMFSDAVLSTVMITPEVLSHFGLRLHDNFVYSIGDLNELFSSPTLVFYEKTSDSNGSFKRIENAIMGYESNNRRYVFLTGDPIEILIVEANPDFDWTTITK